MLSLHKTVALLQFLGGWLTVEKEAVKTYLLLTFLIAVSYNREKKEAYLNFCLASYISELFR